MGSGKEMEEQKERKEMEEEEEGNENEGGGGEERSNKYRLPIRRALSPSLFYIIHGTEEYLNKYERYFCYTASFVAIRSFLAPQDAQELMLVSQCSEKDLTDVTPVIEYTDDHGDHENG